MSAGGRIILGLGLLGGTLGCLVWPFPTGGLLSGRGRIRKEYTAPLVVGKATREDAMLLLGQPDLVLRGGHTLIYHWTEERGFFAVFGSSGGGVIPFPAHRSVKLDFDADGRLLAITFNKGSDAPTLLAEVRAAP